MRYSKIFTKTLKEADHDEVSKNAQLLTRAGFVYKEMAGVYAYLPLGLRVLNKINEIIREEMNAIGGVEMFLTVLQSKTLWEQSNRWSDEVVDDWFKTALKNGSEVGLGFTHEEPLTKLMKSYISSYRDLPQYPYQIQTKFRNELRAKSGIMRGREFLMKDLYSFSKDQAEHDTFYEKCKEAYLRIFERVGLGDRTFVTFASGGSFSKYSHEFQTVTEAGEDTIYLDREKKFGINKEVYTDEVLNDLGISRDSLEEVKTIEVGNIFSLGTKFSDALDLTFVDADGSQKKVIMGCYGIGPGRVMGTVVEVLSDDKGIVWPESIAPFQVYLISFGKDAETEALYEDLKDKGIEVLYDDRDKTAGEKFADCDLLGIPLRVVLSHKLEEGKLELKKRDKDEARVTSKEELFNSFS